MTQAGSTFTLTKSLQHPIVSPKKVLIIILIVSAIFSECWSQASISVNPVSKIINANTVYEFTIADSLIRTITSAQAVIQISFPSSLFTLNTGASYTCTNTDTPSTSYPCRATTTNVVQINNPIISTVVFKVSISLIRNPSSTEQVTFGYAFRYTNNSTIISQNTTDLFRNYLPGALTSCTASFSPNTVHTASELTISITLGNEVKSNGSIFVSFPTVWSDSASSAFPPIMTTASQGCTRRSTNNFLSSTLSCSTVGQQVLLTNSFNNTAPSTTGLSFSISNILSPPTINNGNSIVVTTLTQSYSEIDKMTCIINPVTVRSIAGVNPLVQLTVGVSTQFIFDFLAPTPIASGDKLIISAVSPNDAFFSLLASSTVQILFNALTLTVDSANSTSLTLNFPSMSNVIPASQRISVIQGFFVKPLISSGAKSLTLALRRGSFEYASQSFALTIQPNVLSNTSISLSTSVVSSLATYILGMTTSNTLGIRSRVVITLPVELSMANGACTSITTVSAPNNPSSINSSLGCNVASSRTITLTGVNSNTLSAGERLIITIANILNSQSTERTNTFMIYTYFGEVITDATDFSSNQTVTMTPATIGLASVSSFVPRVAQDTTYTISYTVRTKFLANAKIRIGIPPELSIGSTLSTTFSIAYTNGTPTTGFQSCPVTSLTLNSVQYLDLTSISSTVLAASTVITMRIATLINPTSLRPSSSFRIIQIDSRGYEVEKLETSLTVTNTVTNVFPVLYASQDPVRMNGETVIYTLYFKSSIDLDRNDFLDITLEAATSRNSQISFSNPITSCDVFSVLNNVKTRLTTTVQKISSSLLRVNLGQGLPSSQTYEIAINTIERARTQEAPNNLTLQSFKYVSASLSYGISEGRISPRQTNRRNVMQSVSLNILANPSQLFSPQSFAITVVPKIPLLSGDYLIVEIPNLYTFTGSIVTVTPTTNLVTVASQSLCIQSAYFCSHFSSDPYKIRVQEFSTIFSNLTSVTFTIKNNLYRSPSTFAFVGAGYYFKATSFASNGFMIDQTVQTGTPATNLNSAEFYLSCNTNIATYHCMTCSPAGLCTSCYQPVTFNSTDYTLGGFKFLTSDSRCLSFCGIGYFIDSNSNLCTKCDSPCNTCEITTITCLSCIQNITTNKYFSGNKTCLLICPDGFYPDPGNICIRCSTQCNTCVSDALTCTSCPSGTFLNSVTRTCVTAVNCPSGTFANSLTNICGTCHISCSGCLSQSVNCLNCATGYIVDFTNGTFKNCTNLCPPGKVNDTVNNLGCRCETQCKTCQGTVSTCKSCDATSIYKYFYGTSCLISCPESTYASVIPATATDICVACSQANCRKCDSAKCSQCVGQYALYQGRCFESCPTASVLQIGNGVRKCEACSVGCINCDLGLASCSTCDAGFIREGNSTGVFCTTACSAGTVNLNNTICLSSCPDGYENIAQVCRLKENTTNTTITVQESGLTKTRQVPFPFIIASFILLVIVLLSKLILPTSIVSTLLTTIIGVLEPFSWIAAVAVCLFEISEGKHWPTSSIGVYLILAALGVNFILNIIAIVFYSKYISKDSKFNDMFLYNEKKVFLGKCPTISILGISVLVSHKILQLLFSNFLLSRHFSYKLETVKKMQPLNYLLFCSIIPSLLAIVGGCIISYELQNYNIESSAFIAALDMILVTVLGIITSLWVTNRKSQDYEKDIMGGVNQKHYTEEILVEGHVEEVSQKFNQVFMEQSGVRRTTNDGKSYYYQASKIHKGQNTHDNDRLSKRQTVRNPIHKSNHKKIRGSNLSDEQSSQALVINQKNKRRNLKDQFSSDDDHNNIDQDDGIEVIDLQKTKQNLTDQSKEMPLISKIRYPNKDAQQKPEELTSMSTQQKKNLKDKIESQISPQQKEKLSVLGKEKQLKIKKKKEKIEQILKMQNAEKEKLSHEQRAKVEKVQDAVDLLKRKQIKIEEYLLYSEIIKEQSGEYDDDSEQQISQIDQKTNTIIKGILDEDQQLDEVINLSPKRKIIQSHSGLFNSKSKEKQKTSPKKQTQPGLQRSRSRQSNSVPKSNDKKETSKEKTIKKQPNTTNKKPIKSQNKNKTKQPNDLQVNCNIENGDQDHNKQCNSQEEPELPKNRSNIVANNEKNRNRSQKQLNPKKGIFNRGDIMMIDVGSNRHNRTDNEIHEFGGMEEEYGDNMPPNFLRSTQKVEYKKNHPLEGLRNPYDSELDRQSMKSLENPDMDFFNEISPSKFGVQNKKFDYIQTQDMPVKPRIVQQGYHDNDITMQRKGKSPRKNDGFDIYQGEQLDDDQNYRSKVDMNNTMNRSSSDMRDFKSVILRKSMQNQKLKQLQKIYMPKDKKIKTKRDNSLSRISSRKD